MSKKNCLEQANEIIEKLRSQRQELIESINKELQMLNERIQALLDEKLRLQGELRLLKVLKGEAPNVDNETIDLFKQGEVDKKKQLLS